MNEIREATARVRRERIRADVAGMTAIGASIGIVIVSGVAAWHSPILLALLSVMFAIHGVSGTLQDKYAARMEREMRNHPLSYLFAVRDRFGHTTGHTTPLDKDQV